MFGKRKSKDILLTCPYCKKQQNEPRHALSTFCRSCGEHYKIKNGEAVGSPGAGLSGISTFRELGEVELISDKPKFRNETAPVEKPAPKEEVVEPVKIEKEHVESRPETSITSVKETGAETWLEGPEDGDIDAKAKEPEESIEEKKEAPTESAPKPVKQPVADVPGPLAKKTEAEPAADSDEEDDEEEELISNPIARAAAEAAAKEKQIRDLELKLEKAADDEDQPTEKKEKGSSSSLGADAQPKETLAAGSMEAMFRGLSTDVDVAMRADKVVPEKEEKEEPKPAAKKVEVEKPLDPKKMPSDFVPPSKKGGHPHSRPIRCFKCNHQQMVSLSASSSQCGRCSVYISLSDYDIKTQQSQTIRTRGNVTIHRRGSLIGCDIACHDLTVLGKISGSVDCSGNATFKNSGKVMGSMHCKHLQVEKKCELTFPQGVVAESADIHGIVNGDITCSGTVRIFRTGAVNGDATAKAIVLKDGGILSGQMSIQHNVDIELPLKRGYDPSIID